MLDTTELWHTKHERTVVRCKRLAQCSTSAQTFGTVPSTVVALVAICRVFHVANRTRLFALVQDGLVENIVARFIKTVALLFGDTAPVEVLQRVQGTS